MSRSRVSRVGDHTSYILAKCRTHLLQRIIFIALKKIASCNMAAGDGLWGRQWT